MSRAYSYKDTVVSRASSYKDTVVSHAYPHLPAPCIMVACTLVVLGDYTVSLLHRDYFKQTIIKPFFFVFVDYRFLRLCGVQVPIFRNEAVYIYTRSSWRLVVCMFVCPRCT